jgi:predicted ribosome quality control (RQC) complex YloA/Tae2 family protein
MDKPVDQANEQTADLSGVVCYRSSDGFEILVGRNARDNDELTFRLAAQDDFWLHVAPTSGSHVVVRNPDKLTRLPRAALREAAGLAVWHSKSRAGGRVAVHVTRVRFVSKRRGAPAGQVQLKRFDVVQASPKDRPADPAQ